MKYIVVTGSAGGIGKETALKLLQKGYGIIGLDISDSNINDHNYHHIYCDISKQESITNAASKIKEISNEIYMVYNLAGIFLLQTLIEGDIDDLRKIIDINFFGVCQINKALYPLLKKGSRIVVFSSEVARYSPQPFNGYYALSKIVVDRYADVLRRELNYVGISVIKVQCGAIKTNLLSGVNGQYEKTIAKTQTYKEPLTKLKKLMDDEINKQVDPSVAAKKLVKIALVKHPKISYKIKNSPKLQVLDKLPERTQDFIYKKVIK